MSPTRKISIVPLMAVSFISMLGYGIVLPSLVYVVQTFHGTNFLYGALGASYSACQFVGAPMLGKLSDRFGRKRILFLSVFGSAVAWVLFIVAFRLPMTMMGTFTTSMTGAVSITLPMLCIFIARSFDGLTAGDVSVANAYVADITTHEERKADFGKMGVAGNLGFILGPALAGILAQTPLGLNLPIYLALGTSIFGLLLIVFVLPESRPRKMKEMVENASTQNILGHGAKDTYESEKPAKMTLRKALTMDHIPLLLGIYFVFFLAFSLFVAAMPLYATESLHWSITETGIFFSVLSIVIVITEGPILTWFNKRASAEALTIWGTFIVVLSYISLLVPSPVFAYAAAVLYALGNGLMWPSFLSLLSDRAGENQGYIQGLGNSAGALASIAGLLVGGILFTAMKGGVFIVPAALVFIVFVLSFRLKHRPQGDAI
jgi:DHA1 family tetracycline resistance protein-like MFS transporter